MRAWAEASNRYSCADSCAEPLALAQQIEIEIRLMSMIFVTFDRTERAAKCSTRGRLRGNWVKLTVNLGFDMMRCSGCCLTSKWGQRWFFWRMQGNGRVEEQKILSAKKSWDLVLTFRILYPITNGKRDRYNPEMKRTIGWVLQEFPQVWKWEESPSRSALIS